MEKPATIKYRAFLSYAHADRGWGRWLHERLEQFRLDADLAAGATLLAGPLDNAGRSKLLPIFIDRGNFTGGTLLTNATIAALDDSASLLVLCSPMAASRPVVAEEVRLFRQRHPGRPIIPVIIAGTPPDCFPPALRYALNPDGAVGTTPITVLGVDLRYSGDGRALGIAKIVAGLLGLPDANEVFRREERRLRREGYIRVGIAALFFAVVGAGGYFLLDSQNKAAAIVLQEGEKRQALAIATQLLGANRTAAASPGAEQSLIAALTTLQANATAGDSDAAKAYDLLKAGKSAEALPLLVAAADAQKRKAAEGNKNAAKAYRDAAAIAKLAEPWRARELYAEAVRLDPEDLGGLLNHAVMLNNIGKGAEAEEVYRRLLSIAISGPDDYYLYWGRLGLGDIKEKLGHLGAATVIYKEASVIADRAIRADPGNAKWQLDLTASYERIGDILIVQDNLEGALACYQDALAIRERLAKADFSKVGGYLSVSYDRAGDVLKKKGLLDKALTSYQSSLAIRERLANANLAEVSVQRSLSVSHSQIAVIQREQGNLKDALDSILASLEINNRLAMADPKNANWQRNLYWSYIYAGNILKDQSKINEALASYRSSLGIADRLTKADPDNAGWQRDLAVSHQKLANMGDDERGHYREIVRILKVLATSGQLAPADKDWPTEAEAELKKLGG